MGIARTLLNPAVVNYKALVLVIVLALLALPVSERTIASDRDVDPLMIYIDPETGKYTTQQPGHDSPVEEDKNLTDATQETLTTPVITPITPALIISGGLIIVSYLLSLTMVRVTKDQSIAS